MVIPSKKKKIISSAAPQTGHGPEADLWSLGILIYELVEVGWWVGRSDKWQFYKLKVLIQVCEVLDVLHREDLLLSDQLHKRLTPIFCRFASKASDT